MSLWDRTKALLDRRGLRFAFSVAATHLARSQGKGVNHVSTIPVWIHDTTERYFAYQKPFVRLDMIKMDRAAQRHFFGDIVLNPVTRLWTLERESGKRH